MVERITGPDQVFERDRVPASDDEVELTVGLFLRHRASTVDLVRRALAAGALDASDPAVVQPGWMPWRTPRSLARHLAEGAAAGYSKRLGLPTRAPGEDLLEDLDVSADHLVQVLRSMPRGLVTRYRGEVWTSVELLRRTAWHERVDQVFLRRRLRAAGVLVPSAAGAPSD